MTQPLCLIYVLPHPPTQSHTVTPIPSSYLLVDLHGRFIHSLNVEFQPLPRVNNAAVETLLKWCFCGCISPLLLSIQLAVRLLSYRIILCLAFWCTVKIFQVAGKFANTYNFLSPSLPLSFWDRVPLLCSSGCPGIQYVKQAVSQVIKDLCHHTWPVLPPPLTKVMLQGMKWYLTVALIYTIFLIFWFIFISVHCCTSLSICEPTCM